MNRDSANIEPPASIFGADARSEGPMSPGKKSTKARSQSHRNDVPRSEVSYVNGQGQDVYANGQPAHDDDDVKSNTQVGMRSELDLDVNGFHHEPGPTDLPGPHYESYDSGPSFGNFGPMPTDYQPNWQQNQYGGPPESHVTNAARYALPESVASPRSASAKIVVESPSSPRSKQRSKASTSGESPMTPTKLRSQISNVGSPEAPLSPRSRTETVPGTVYPPLPTSPGMDGGYSEYAMSPRARSKAPSISPSDSPSNAKAYRSHKSKSNAVDSKPPSRRDMSRSPPPAGPSNTRPFSPWRQAATTQDLMHAAVRGRAFIPDTIEENDQSQASGSADHPPPSSPKKSTKEPSIASRSRAKSDVSKSPSKAPSKSPSKASSKSPSKASSKAPSTVAPAQPDMDDSRSATPRPRTPTELSKEEAEIIKHTLSRGHHHHAPLTPRTSYAASVLEPEVVHSHFHDDDLCELLRQESDPNVSEVVKRVIRKAIRSRVKKLGMKYDSRSLEEYKKSVHEYDTLSQHPNATTGDETPEWAKELIQGMVVMQQRIEGLGPKIEGLKGPSVPLEDGSRFKALDDDDDDEYDQSGMTQTVNIQTHATGTMADSMYQPPETDILGDEHDHDHDGADYLDQEEDHDHDHAHTEGGETYTRRGQSDLLSENRDDSPGQQYLEEELYKLRQRQAGSQSGLSHRTWEVARDDGTQVDDYDEEENPAAAPTIPDSNAGGYTDQRTASPPLPPIPPPEDRRIATPQQIWQAGQEYNGESPPLAPWQRIHQRLLGWAIIWPMSELENALRSTTRSHQVDEVALSIWTTQTYKRYVRTRMTDTPQGVVDRLFVPPNMADAISSAVFNGRHGDACGMLRDLWSPFGLEGMPRLLVVLAKHRNDPNHWLVHRFSLPDGSLTTYDTYPGRAIHDGRPLGWWFAIRIAWPNALYPSPDHLLQKMVRVHRPLQLPVDNAVAAAGIWRNILMGSRAERSLDLERLRDLINTEVKNLRQRKEMGKLSIGGPRPNWEDMN